MQPLAAMIEMLGGARVGLPARRALIDVIADCEVAALFFDPLRQHVPVAQQALMRDFHDSFAAAPICEQQAFLHQLIDERAAGRRQVGAPRRAPHRLIVVRIDRHQPRDERRAQQRECCGTRGAVGRQRRLDLDLHDVGDAAEGRVLVEPQVTVFAVVAIEPGQREAEQRQRLSAFGAVGDEAIDELGLHLQRPASSHRRARCRPENHFAETIRAHRLQVIEYHALELADLRCRLQRLVAIRANRDRDDRRQRLAAEQIAEQLQEVARFLRRGGAEQLLRLIEREHQGRCRRRGFIRRDQAIARCLLDRVQQRCEAGQSFAQARLHVTEVRRRHRERSHRRDDRAARPRGP